MTQQQQPVDSRIPDEEHSDDWGTPLTRYQQYVAYAACPPIWLDVLPLLVGYLDDLE